MNWFKCLPCPTSSEVEHVTTLDYSSSSLREVPLAVFNFERTLQTLHLNSNKITELTRMLFQCEELRYLDLSDNEISNIPPLIDKLTNLESLLLNRNCLSHDSIPFNVHRCQKLKALHLNSNSLSKVPASVTRLVTLRELHLNNCDIEFLPANFGRLNSLRILELRENHLTTLPKSLKRLTDLQRLDISSNMFDDLPDVIGTMTNLTELWLNDNFLNCIPDCVGNLDKLSHFDISCNRLLRISKEIGLCTSMTLLVCSMNDLRQLPETIGNMYRLRTLKLDHNLLESLPETIGKLSNLEELDVQFNRLRSFPHSIGMLRKLTSLIAAQNTICNLPTEIGSCTVLSVLSLHYNNLKYLPEEIGHLQNLTSLWLVSNSLLYLPITVLGLRKLKALWLSHNQSRPLTILQSETLKNGRVVLTCVFLPQVEVPPDIPQVVKPGVPKGRRIGFMEPSVPTDISARLSRIPTPHPKAFVKYQRTLENTLRRNQDGVSQNIGVDAIHVKEANIVPMKSATDNNEPVVKDTLTQVNDNGNEVKLTEELSNPQYHTIVIEDSNDGIDNELSETNTDYITAIGSERGNTPVETRNEAVYGTYHPFNNCSTRPVYRHLTLTAEELANLHHDQIENHDLNDQNDNEISGGERATRPSDYVTSPDSERVTRPVYRHLKLTAEELANLQHDQIENHDLNDQNDNEISERLSDYVTCTSSERASTPVENVDGTNRSLDTRMKNPALCLVAQEDIQLPSCSKPKQPPPYHIAAAYSRGAHFFLNSAEKTEKEAQPKHFTQDQPLNILNPQPKHARCVTQKDQTNTCSYSNPDETNTVDSKMIQGAEKVLTVTSSLLRLDAKQNKCKRLMEYFFQLKCDKPFRVSTVLEIKSVILETAEYLLSYKKIDFHENNVHELLDHVHEKAEAYLDNEEVQYSECNIDLEIEEKLKAVEITAILLRTNYRYQEHRDLINLIEHIDFREHFTVLKPKTDREAMIVAKHKLIKIILFFLSTSSTDKEYKCMFGKFLHFYGNMICLPKPDLSQTINRNPHQRDLEKNLDLVDIDHNKSRKRRCLNKGPKGNMNWVFGAHRNPRIVKVELPQCHYFLGFSVSHSEEGVFVDEVDKEGNAFQKLFTGDKILMLDDRDITKMKPEEALQAVHVWGPETETFLISRN